MHALLLLLTLLPQPITPSDFARLHEAIQAKPKSEAWEAVDWEMSLTTARIRAVKENKPILLWEMDGHPLGCT